MINTSLESRQKTEQAIFVIYICNELPSREKLFVIVAGEINPYFRQRTQQVKQ
jgi:hypothetical protein